jgi:hypothetical protein
MPNNTTTAKAPTSIHRGPPLTENFRQKKGTGCKSQVYPQTRKPGLGRKEAEPSVKV